MGRGRKGLKNLFDRFRQADGSTTRRYGGLGIGLAIVRQLVELHGGRVRAHSNGPGQGASFTVQLPVYVGQVRGNTPVQHEPGDVPVIGPDALRGVRVLAVEDQSDMREYIRRILAEYGATVTTAASAGEAAIFKCQPYKLPADRYSQWSEINPLRFDPRQMMNQ